MNRHWTLDELTDRLYGIREQDEHLETCRECATRFEELNRRRAAVAMLPERSPARCAAERDLVLDRIDSPSRYIPRWVPALTAAACLSAVVLFVHRPAQVAPVDNSVKTSAVTVSDAQLFADIYSVEESSEPRAAGPIHELFEDGQQ